ncbi:MAG: hypothetical protein PHX05_09935 [Acidobacteriota bacterium]|nr:hypothetical protein [Acidobacteriota bacterium]
MKGWGAAFASIGSIVCISTFPARDSFCPHLEGNGAKVKPVSLAYLLEGKTLFNVQLYQLSSWDVALLCVTTGMSPSQAYFQVLWSIVTFIFIDVVSHFEGPVESPPNFLLKHQYGTQH